MSSDPKSPSANHHQMDKSSPQRHAQITAAGMGRVILYHVRTNLSLNRRGKGVLLCLTIQEKVLQWCTKGLFSKQIRFAIFVHNWS